MLWSLKKDKIKLNLISNKFYFFSKTKLFLKKIKLNEKKKLFLKKTKKNKIKNFKVKVNKRFFKPLLKAVYLKKMRYRKRLKIIKSMFFFFLNKWNSLKKKVKMIKFETTAKTNLRRRLFRSKKKISFIFLLKKKKEVTFIDYLNKKETLMTENKIKVKAAGLSSKKTIHKLVYSNDNLSDKKIHLKLKNFNPHNLVKVNKRLSKKKRKLLNLYSFFIKKLKGQNLPKNSFLFIYFKKKGLFGKKWKKLISVNKFVKNNNKLLYGRKINNNDFLLNKKPSVTFNFFLEKKNKKTNTKKETYTFEIPQEYKVSLGVNENLSKIFDKLKRNIEISKKKNKLIPTRKKKIYINLKKIKSLRLSSFLIKKKIKKNFKLTFKKTKLLTQKKIIGFLNKYKEKNKKIPLIAFYNPKRKKNKFLTNKLFKLQVTPNFKVRRSNSFYFKWNRNTLYTKKLFRNTDSKKNFWFLKSKQSYLKKKIIEGSSLKKKASIAAALDEETDDYKDIIYEEPSLLPDKDPLLSSMLKKKLYKKWIDGVLPKKGYKFNKFLKKKKNFFRTKVSFYKKKIKKPVRIVRLYKRMYGKSNIKGFLLGKKKNDTYMLKKHFNFSGLLNTNKSKRFLLVYLKKKKSNIYQFKYLKLKKKKKGLKCFFDSTNYNTLSIIFLRKVFFLIKKKYSKNVYISIKIILLRLINFLKQKKLFLNSLTNPTYSDDYIQTGLTSDIVKLKEDTIRSAKFISIKKIQKSVIFRSKLMHLFNILLKKNVLNRKINKLIKLKKNKIYFQSKPYVVRKPKKTKTEKSYSNVPVISSFILKTGKEVGKPKKNRKHRFMKSVTTKKKFTFKHDYFFKRNNNKINIRKSSIFYLNSKKLSFVFSKYKNFLNKKPEYSILYDFLPSNKLIKIPTNFIQKRVFLFFKKVKKTPLKLLKRKFITEVIQKSKKESNWYRKINTFINKNVIFSMALHIIKPFFTTSGIIKNNSFFFNKKKKNFLLKNKKKKTFFIKKKPIKTLRGCNLNFLKLKKHKFIFSFFFKKFNTKNKKLFFFSKKKKKKKTFTNDFVPNFALPTFKSFLFKQNSMLNSPKGLKLFILNSKKIIKCKRPFLRKMISAGTMLISIILLMLAGDLNPIVDYMFSTFRKKQYFRHRRMFYTIRSLMKRLINKAINFSNLSGLKIKFKGKIAVRGGLRKKTMKIERGSYSSSRLKNIFKFKSKPLWTKGGAVGLKVFANFDK